MPTAPTRLMVGTRKGLLVFHADGRQWRLGEVHHEGIPVTLTGHDPRTGRMFACMDHGHWGCKLSISDDAGTSWEEVPAPAYPGNAEIKAGVPATLRYLWAFALGGADQPGRIYLGTEPGGLFASDDGGRTFGLVEGLWNHPSRLEKWMGGGRDHPGVHSVWVDPRDSARVLVGISCAGVFETRDGGASWAPRNVGLPADFLPDPTTDVGHDPHRLSICAAEPDTIWHQNHFGVFRSVDGGVTWTDISEPDGPARFGFAICADERDPDTAWVVPAITDQNRAAYGRGLCVSRTEDGGATWTALREGLPQTDCFDLVYRHALDLTGDTLAFGSTTGNLYLSADRGESWRALGHHLPPVYSVAFA